MKCTTKTFVAKKTTKIPSVSIEELLTILPGSKKTNFRNCVVSKLGNKTSIKLYTNLTLQITGEQDINKIVKIIRDLNLDNFFIECVMSNWTIKISEKPINLLKIMKILCENNIIAYFLRGVPLIVKYRTTTEIDYIELKGNEIYNRKKEVDTEVSVLLFKTGTCIISGKSEEVCLKTFQALKQIIDV